MQSNAIDISPCYIRSYSDGRRGERRKSLHCNTLCNKLAQTGVIGQQGMISVQKYFENSW